MKSFLLVMILFPLPLLAGFGQSVDQDVTVVGKDETIMTVPDPPVPGPVAIPDPDLWLPETPAIPVVLPPTPAGEPAPEEQPVQGSLTGQVEQPVQDPVPTQAPAG